MNNGHTYPHQNLTACANYNDAKVTSTPLNLASQSGILNSAQIIAEVDQQTEGPQLRLFTSLTVHRVSKAGS